MEVQTKERGVTIYEAKDGQEIKLSFDTIKRYLVQGHPELVTDQEMMFFMGVCKSRGLNPFIKDAYLIKYSDAEGAAIITSIDFFRKRARVQRDCRGWKKGIIVERNGEVTYTDGLMLEGDKLLGGWFKGKPSGWDEPLLLEVNLKGYIKKKKDGSVTKFWAPENQPSQIMKVAESQGLRTLWPDEFQQLYTPEEMGEADMFQQAERKSKKQPIETEQVQEDIYTVKEMKKEPPQGKEHAPGPDESDPKPAPKTPEKAKAETSDNTPEQPMQEPEKDPLEPPQSGNGNAFLVCHQRKGEPRVPLAACGICTGKEDCKDLAAYEQAKQAAEAFMVEIDQYTEKLGLSAIQRNLRLKGKAKDAKDVPVEKRAEVLKALKEELDKKNAA